MIPDTIGRYEVLRELGRGGMATVYLARDPSFRRRVAVKFLPPGFAHTPEFRARFEREAQVIAALEHPYIVPVYDFGEDPETKQPFLVMRYMPGGTLVDRIAGRPMSLAHVIPIVQRVAEALEEAHSQSIIHRDLKPANVMFDARDQAFLSDFGLAKMFDNNTTAITLTGVMGTPAYMSPEQALGEDLDGRSDVYALGVVVYEMLTGRQPYEAKTPAAMMIKHVTVLTPLIDTGRLNLPIECNQVLATALAKDRDERYRTPNAFAEALMALAPSGRARKVLPPRAPRYENPRTMDAEPTTRLQLLSSMLRLDPLTDRKKVAWWRAVWGGALAGGLVLVLILGGGYWWWTAGSVAGASNTLTPTLTATYTAPPSVTATLVPITDTPASTPIPPTPTLTPPTIANTATFAPTNTTAPATRTPARVQPTSVPTQPPANTTAPLPTNTNAPPPTNPPPTNPPPAPTETQVQPSATPSEIPETPPASLTPTQVP